MVTKQQLDKYFIDNRTQIKEHIVKSFYKFGVKGEEPDFFFSETYLYLLSKIGELKTEKDIKNYTSTFIHNNTYWNNSSVREDYVASKRETIVSFEPNTHDATIYEMDDESEEDLVNEYRAVVEMYYQSLKSVEKKAVWEIYFIEGKKTITSFSQHIKMSRTVADKFIKEMKKDINEYYKQYKIQYK